MYTVNTKAGRTLRIEGIRRAASAERQKYVAEHPNWRVKYCVIAELINGGIALYGVAGEDPRVAHGKAIDITYMFDDAIYREHHISTKAVQNVIGANADEIYEMLLVQREGLTLEVYEGQTDGCDYILVRDRKTDEYIFIDEKWPQSSAAIAALIRYEHIKDFDSLANHCRISDVMDGALDYMDAEIAAEDNHAEAFRRY